MGGRLGDPAPDGSQVLVETEGLLPRPLRAHHTPGGLLLALAEGPKALVHRHGCRCVDMSMGLREGPRDTAAGFRSTVTDGVAQRKPRHLSYQKFHGFTSTSSCSSWVSYNVQPTLKSREWRSTSEGRKTKDSVDIL